MELKKIKYYLKKHSPSAHLIFGYEKMKHRIEYYPSVNKKVMKDDLFRMFYKQFVESDTVPKARTALTACLQRFEQLTRKDGRAKTAEPRMRYYRPTYTMEQKEIEEKAVQGNEELTAIRQEKRAKIAAGKTVDDILSDLI